MHHGILTETWNSTIVINRLSFNWEACLLITVHHTSPFQSQNFTRVAFIRFTLSACLAFSNKYCKHMVPLVEFCDSWSDTFNNPTTLWPMAQYKMHSHKIKRSIKPSTAIKLLIAPYTKQSSVVSKSYILWFNPYCIRKHNYLWLCGQWDNWFAMTLTQSHKCKSMIHLCSTFTQYMASNS